MECRNISMIGKVPWNKGLSIYLGGKRFEKNQIPWNKGIKTGPNPEHSKRMKGRRVSPETEIKLGQRLSVKTEFKKGNISWSKCKKLLHLRGKNAAHWKGGKPKCLDCGEELNHYEAKKCVLHRVPKGKYNPSWKGGITPINQKIRNSREYILWRTAVFMRDDYTCQKCGDRGGKLEADHIKPFALYPELRLAIDNGRTLCKSCHRQTETFGRIQNFRMEVIN